MQNIDLQISKIVSKNLYQKRKKILEESFAINENDDYKEIIKKHVIIAVNLINEGYDINEISDYIDQASNFLKDKTNTNFDYGQTFKDSMWSMAKEFAIKFILEYIGFGPSIATKLGRGLADISYKDLLIPFKNREYCISHLPNILDAILEVYIRDFLDKKLRTKKTKAEDELELLKAKEVDDARKDDKSIKKYTPRLSYNEYGWSDIPELGLGNIAGELIRKSPTSEAIANVLCKIIHK